MDRRTFTNTLAAAMLGSPGYAPSDPSEAVGEVSVKAFGAVGDGRSDDSMAILAADSSGQRVRYPPGRYLYSSEQNPKFARGVVFDGAHVDGKFTKDIVVFDDTGRLVGLQHNHLEQGRSDFESNKPIRTGYFVPPPLSAASYSCQVDLIAHWYNDFGLESTRRGNGKNGGLTWYYWDWAFRFNPYDPQRHPLLGWYRGDDINVLDWQCYWLCEYGITGVNLSGEFSSISWTDPGDKNFWKYQLFKKVKNFRKLKYVLWLGGDDVSSTTINFSSILDICQEHDNFYSIKMDGKMLPVIYIFDGKTLSRRLAKENIRASSFFASLSSLAKGRGFPGVVFLVRHPDGDAMRARRELYKAGCYYLPAGYSDMNGAIGRSFGDLASSWKMPARVEVPNVCTSKSSVPPHPSKWTWKGSSPALFGFVLEKAVRSILNAGSWPYLVQIYNVAEWAEGGAGLQPNVLDRFGYLEAVREVARKFPRQRDRENSSRSYIREISTHR